MGGNDGIGDAVYGAVKLFSGAAYIKISGNWYIFNDKKQSCRIGYGKHNSVVSVPGSDRKDHAIDDQYGMEKIYQKV